MRESNSLLARDIIHGGWSSALDPMCYNAENDKRNSRVVINAYVPFNRQKTFPPIASAFPGGGRCSAPLARPLSATSRHMRCSKDNRYSITSSARASSVGGISRPSALRLHGPSPSSPLALIQQG